MSDIVLRKGSQRTSVDPRNTELLRQYYQTGWQIESGADTAIDGVVRPDVDGNIASMESIPFAQYFDEVGRGAHGQILEGADAAAVRNNLNARERAQQEVEGILPAIGAAGEGIASMLPGGSAVVEGLRSTIYDDPELAERLAAEGVEQNSLAYGLGAGGMFLGQYLATGGLSGASATSTLGRIGQQYAMGVGGAARGAGMLARASAARLGLNSGVGRAAALLGAAAAEDATASVFTDLNQVIAGREEFVAENILANAAKSALLGVGVEGAARGIGAAFNRLRGVARGATEAVEETMPAMRDVNLAQLDDEIAAIRASDSVSKSEDIQSAVMRHLGDARAALDADSARAVALRDATATKQAGSVLEDVASTVTRGLDESFTSLKSSIDDLYRPEVVRQTLRQSDTLRNLSAVDAKQAARLDLNALRSSAQRLPKKSRQVVAAIDTALRRNSASKNAVDSYAALVEAQDDLRRIGMLKDAPGELAALRQELDTMLYRPTWGDAATLRKTQQEGIQELRNAAENLASVAGIRRGAKVDLDKVRFSEAALARKFRELSSQNITQDFDNVVAGIYNLRNAAETIAPELGKKFDDMALQLVAANKAAGLKAAWNTLAKQSDEMGKNIATFRSANGLIGAGIGFNIVGMPGMLAGAGLAALARPVSQVHIKSWLEGLLKGNTTSYSRGMARLQSALRGARLTAVRGIMGMSQKKQEERFEEEWQKNLQFMQNPYDAADALSIDTAPLAEDAYSLVAPLQQGLVRRQAYIQQVIPQPMVDVLTGRIKAMPSRAQMSDFMKRIEVMDDPFMLLQRAADGSITAAQVEAVQFNYPELYADMMASVAEVVVEQAQKSTIPYRMRVNLHQAFGIDIDETLTASFTAAMQSTAAQTPEQDMAIQGSRPISTRKMGVAEQTQTVAERIAN